MPRWTLRTWLIVPTAVIVTILSATGAILQTDTLVRAWLGSTRQLSEQAARQVTELILLRLEEQTGSVPVSREAQRQFWLDCIARDPKLNRLLESSGAGASSIAEISVSGANGVVVASSNRARRGSPAMYAPPLSSLEALDPLSRVRDVWAAGREYEFRLPVGLPGDLTPLFSVQVLVSNALLREMLSPGINRIIATAAFAYGIALLLVCVVAEVTRKNLRRLEELIDRIGLGQRGARFNPGAAPAALPPAPATAEFDAVRSKLTLMESRVRGALHEAEDYRQHVSALLKGIEEAIILFEGEQVVLNAGAIENLLGFAPDQINGREAGELFGPNTHLMQAIARSWNSGEPVHNAEVEWVSPDRAKRLIVNMDYITDSADPLRTLTLLRLRDAEGATQVESQLQVVTRLEAINKLTGGVAHEIKNPLNAIAARLALLETMVEGEPEAEGEIKIISDEIQRLDRVVRTFLDFTQPVDIRREELDIAELARTVVELVRPSAAARGVAVSFHAVSNDLLTYGDHDLLQQAIMNIVVNALEATPKGGEVLVTASRCDRSCRLRISDTGPGIEPAAMGRLFQLYFTTKPGGSGIGLAVAYRSLQLHGGDIHVETGVAKGTTFELTLPAVPREVAAIA